MSMTLWVIEGIGSYDAQIARQADLAGYRPVKAPLMLGKGRRGLGKSDPIDARRNAAAVLPLSEDELRTPRMDERVCAAARVLLAARDGLTKDRTRAANSLTALVRVNDLGIDGRRPLDAVKMGEISRWRPREEDLAAATARGEAVRLAKRILAQGTEIAENTNRLSELVEASPAAELLKETGIGPFTAATALVGSPHPGRFRSEAAFAALGGVSPLPPPHATPADTGSTAAATGTSTAP